MKQVILYSTKYFFRAFTVLLMIALIYMKLMGVTRCMVQGESMYPTLENKERLLMVKKKTPKRFSMVVFDKEDTVMIKRVIGLPGDEVKVEHGKLYINGTETDEAYLTDDLTKKYKNQSFAITVDEDSYYVLGDNRDHSVDSRDFGQIKQNQILGVILCRIKKTF